MFLFSLRIGRQASKEFKKRQKLWHYRFSDLFTYCLELKNFMIQDNFMF